MFSEQKQHTISATTNQIYSQWSSRWPFN